MPLHQLDELGFPRRGLRPARRVLRGRPPPPRPGVRPLRLRRRHLRPPRAQGGGQDPLRQDPHLPEPRRDPGTAGMRTGDGVDPAREPHADRHPLPPRGRRGRRRRRVRGRRQAQALAPGDWKPRAPNRFSLPSPPYRAEGPGSFSPGQRPGFGPSPHYLLRPEGPRYRPGRKSGTPVSAALQAALASMGHPEPRAMPWAEGARAFSPARPQTDPVHLGDHNLDKTWTRRLRSRP